MRTTISFIVASLVACSTLLHTAASFASDWAFPPGDRVLAMATVVAIGILVLGLGLYCEVASLRPLMRRTAVEAQARERDAIAIQRTDLRYRASLLGLALSVAFTLAACFGPPFTLRAPAEDAGKGGAGGHGGDGDAGGDTTGGGTGGSDTDPATTLIIQDAAGNPVSSIKVVVNDEAGGVAKVTESGEDGRATVTIPVGGSASVFSTVDAALHIFTLLDPPPGLTIPVTIARPASALPETTSYQVVVLAQPVATDRVYVWSTCDSAPPEVPLDNALCRDAATIDFLAVAYDAEKNAIGWGTTPNQPTSPGGDALFVPLDVTQTAFHTLDTAITGTLPATSYAGVTLRGDLSLEDMLTLPSPVAPPPLAVTLRVPGVPGMGYRVREFAWSWGDASGPLSKIERERHYAVLPASTTFAVSSMAPLSVNPLDIADPIHPELTWSVAGEQRGDQGSLALSWGSGILTVTYEAVFAPDHTTSFRVPDIPAELSSYAPSATTTFGKSISVWYDDFENADGYADVLDGVKPADGLGRIHSGAYLTQP
jgi:hypothetical protein